LRHPQAGFSPKPDFGEAKVSGCSSLSRASKLLRFVILGLQGIISENDVKNTLRFFDL
jgi:hypothetical protein